MPSHSHRKSCKNRTIGLGGRNGRRVSLSKGGCTIWLARSHPMKASCLNLLNCMCTTQTWTLISRLSSALMAWPSRGIRPACKHNGCSHCYAICKRRRQMAVETYDVRIGKRSTFQRVQKCTALQLCARSTHYSTHYSTHDSLVNEFVKLIVISRAVISSNPII